jgi:GxxExxY protein
MEINDLTGEIIGCFIEIHRVLGPGLLESAYEECLAYELTKAGLIFERQKALPVRYKKIQIEYGYRMDFIVENQVVVELKVLK